MKKKGQREPFTEFDKLGRGTPTLVYYPNPKTAHVSWGDGLMLDYSKFHAALDATGMESALMQTWKRHEPQLTKRTELSYGGVHGGLAYAPIPLAMEIRDIVRNYFTRALEIVAAQRNGEAA
jgi:hypothetical protein